MSSREKPNVVCVRSLVPNEKKSATSPISSAVTAARGSSIIVPIGMSSSMPSRGRDLGEHLLGLGAQRLELGDDRDERDHDLGLGSCPRFLSCAVASAIARTCIA